MTLVDALREFMVRWRDDLGSGWKSVLESVEPGFGDVKPTLAFDPGEPIYPARKAAPLPGARPDAHVFRAFDDTNPQAVRCVLVGQDPYPKLSRATGRSFEQGDLEAWTGPGVATSLQRLVQMLCVARTGNPKYVGPLGWQKVVADVHGGTLNLGTPRELFDRLQVGEGLLFLNASLTITRYVQGGGPHQLLGHIPFWKPVVGKVLQHLATRQTGHVVFLLLGNPAHQLADRMGIRAAAERAGVWGTRVKELRLEHPAANNFLRGGNAFVEVNARLAQMGAPPIAW